MRVETRIAQLTFTLTLLTVACADPRAANPNCAERHIGRATRRGSTAGKFLTSHMQIAKLEGEGLPPQLDLQVQILAMPLYFQRTICR